MIDPDSQRAAVLDKDVHAKIQSDLLLARTEYDHLGYYNDGAIFLIETGGDLDGSVKAGNIALDSVSDISESII